MLGGVFHDGIALRLAVLVLLVLSFATLGMITAIFARDGDRPRRRP